MIRIERGDGFVADAQLFHGAGSVVLDDDVCRFRQRVERLAAELGLEIERHRPLVAVHVEETEAVVALELEAHGVAGLVAALGRLDLDDVGAEIPSIMQQ